MNNREIIQSVSEDELALKLSTLNGLGFNLSQVEYIPKDILNNNIDMLLEHYELLNQFCDNDLISQLFCLSKLPDAINYIELALLTNEPIATIKEYCTNLIIETVASPSATTSEGPMKHKMTDPEGNQKKKMKTTNTSEANVQLKELEDFLFNDDDLTLSSTSTQQPILIRDTNITNATLREVHHKILHTTSCADVCRHFKVAMQHNDPYELRAYIGQFTMPDGLPLTITDLKNKVGEDDPNKLLGEQYDQKIPPFPCKFRAKRIEDYSLNYILQVARKCAGLTELNGALNLTSRCLSIYLDQSFNPPLTYAQFVKLTDEELQHIQTKKPVNKCKVSTSKPALFSHSRSQTTLVRHGNITNATLRDVHNMILRATSYAEVSRYFNIDSQRYDAYELRAYIGQFTMADGLPLTITDLKNKVAENDPNKLLGDQYDQKIPPLTCKFYTKRVNDYDINYILQVAKKCTSLAELNGVLNLTGNCLNTHLKQSFNPPLTYEQFVNLTDEELQDICKMGKPANNGI